MFSTSFFLHIICPTHHFILQRGDNIICPALNLSYTPFVLHTIFPTPHLYFTNNLSHTSFVLHNICPTHHWSYTSFVLHTPFVPHLICPAHHFHLSYREEIPSIFLHIIFSTLLLYSYTSIFLQRERNIIRQIVLQFNCTLHYLSYREGI